MGPECLDTHLGAPAQNHVRENSLTGGRIIGTDNRRLGNRRVRDQRRLDLSGRNSMPGHIHHVIDTPKQP